MKNAILFASCLLASYSAFCPQASAANHVISMYYYNPGVGFYYYSPSTLSVPKGDTVTWTNADTFVYNHTTTSGTSPTSLTHLWDSGTMTNKQTFTLDTSGLAAGTYPYICTIDYNLGMTGSLTVTSPANVPPSVSITNPITGAKFLARANVTLMASAADADGTVTNVQFFSGASSLGNVSAAPFNFTVSSLAAGNYTFTAKAFDNVGATTVSAQVVVYVQTNSTISSIAAVTGAGFQFTLNGIAGQSYAIDVSSNLVNWTPLFTNIAPADVFSVTDLTTSGSAQRYYRARQNY